MQKVSAILSAGTWNEDTSWSQQTQIDTQNSGASFGVVWGDKHSSPVTSVSGGHTKGHADSFGFGSTSGATRLASLLAPPPSPRAPVKKVVSDGEGMWLVGMPCFLLLGWFVGSFAWWVVPMAIFCFLLLWGIVEGNKETYKKAGSQYQEDRKSWGLNYSRWNKLFYCARCDRVFMPETGRSEVVSDVAFLVYHD